MLTGWVSSRLDIISYRQDGSELLLNLVLQERLCSVYSGPSSSKFEYCTYNVGVLSLDILYLS